MRGALLTRAQENPPELLPADDHRDGGGAVRGARRETGEESESARPARRRMNPQLKGVEKLDGTYVFDLETKREGAAPQPLPPRPHRCRERDSCSRKNLEASASTSAGLTTEERRMVRELDWAALMRYGASFFCLEKLARVKGVSNPEMVAGFRGRDAGGIPQRRAGFPEPARQAANATTSPVLPSATA